jgi:Uma2 family endonuclease
MTLDLMELPMPVTLRPAAPLSDQELMQFSASNKPYRIEQNKEGEITVMTPLGGIGASNEGLVSAELIMWTRASGRGKSFSPNIGFRLPDGSCLSPDGSWISIERWDALSKNERKGFLPLCPEFVIEVRSETDRRKAIEAKMHLWIENGAKLAWLIDPMLASVTIYRPGDAEETLERPDSVLATEPVAGFILPTSEIWQES